MADTSDFHRLPPDLVDDILGRLVLVDRLALAAACGGTSRRHQPIRPEPPCLVVLPGASRDTAKIFSPAGRSYETARVPAGPATPGHVVVVGSTGGWIVTADDEGATLRMANPATGAHADLPPVATVPFLRVLGQGRWFCVDRPDKICGGRRMLPPPAAYTITRTRDMRPKFYNKVVLSASPRPGSYAAMLILERSIGMTAFATAKEPAWRPARSCDAVEDATHHAGRFYSITYSGVVEAWGRDGATGEFTSEAVAPKLRCDDEGSSTQRRRKYLAAAPDGRLMAVLKDSSDSHSQHPCVAFKVHVLDEARRRWAEAGDIGDLALFVGVNATVCVSTRAHPGIRPGCVYFTDDDVRRQESRRFDMKINGVTYRSFDRGDELRDLGVYSLAAGTVERVEGIGRHPYWPPPAWFTPLGAVWFVDLRSLARTESAWPALPRSFVCNNILFGYLGHCSQASSCCCLVHSIHVSLSHAPCTASRSLARGEPGPAETPNFYVAAEPGHGGFLACVEPGLTDTQTKQTVDLVRVEPD